MSTPPPSATSLRRITPWWPGAPRRARLGLVIAILAIAALAWHHHSDAAAKPHTEHPPSAAAAPSTRAGAPEEVDAPAVGQLAPPTIASDGPAAQDAARDAARRFATNFAAPNGDRDDWLARIAPDVSAQLLEQYRLTDIRNVTAADVTSVDGPVRQEPGTTTFDVTYSDGSQVEIRLETGTEGWKVINVVSLTGNGVRAAPDDVMAQPSPAAPTRGEDQP